MNEIYSSISADELSQLRVSIAQVAVLGALSDDGKIDEKERSEALKLASMRTYTSDEVLQEFYEEVANHFETDFNATIAASEGKSSDDAIAHLRSEIEKADNILAKLSPEFADAFIESQESFAEHIFKAHANFFTHFFKSYKFDLKKRIFGES